MDSQAEDLSFRAQERGKSWVYYCATVLVGSNLSCKGVLVRVNTYKILDSLCRRSKNRPSWTPKTINEVAKAVRKATRLMPSTFWAEPWVSSLGIELSVVLAAAVDDVELLKEVVKLADDVNVDAKTDDRVDTTDPDMDAVDTAVDSAVDTVVGTEDRTVEEAMMAGDI